MYRCLFVSDLHGSSHRYTKLFDLIGQERPSAVFLGGDLLPGGASAMGTLDPTHYDFLNGVIGRNLRQLRDSLQDDYPDIFAILGNDDSRSEEAAVLELAAEGLWHYAHERSLRWNIYTVWGYAHVNPTPFLNKDWEKYDLSRHVDVGCISPEEGYRSVPVSEHRKKYDTIRADLDSLTHEHDMSRAIMLFHAPPYQTHLDRAALDGKMVDHVPLDVHVGSIAIKQFIESRQPLITLHGHVHESAQITGKWRSLIGETWSFSAAHDGPELSVIDFEPDAPQRACRRLL